MKLRIASCLLVVSTLLPAALPASAPPQEGQTLRVVVDIVPLDVIVLDREGNPVTDLRADDFLIREDGLPRKIVNFILERGPDAEAVEGRRVSMKTVEKPIERTFLIFLGRGRHAEYFQTMDNLISFVENDLGPSDSVAVLAYGRATDFTREHAGVVALLRRYQERNPAIELAFELRARTLASIYGRPGFVPEETVQKIKELFSEQVARTLPAQEIRHPDDEVYASRSSEELIRLKGMEPAIAVKGENPRETVSAASTEKTQRFDSLRLTRITDLSFDEYLEARASTHSDLQSLLAAVDYLRYREGEKHLLYFTAQGLFLPALEKDEGPAAYASDARVRIHTIQTGGMSMESGYSQSFALTSLRNVSDLSGGRSYIRRWVHEALEEVNRTTSAVYRLAYQQDRLPLDGRYRKIQVELRREGVQVLARTGYYAGPLDVERIDRKKLLTYARTAAAASYPEKISDIRFDLKVETERTRDGATPCNIDVRIRPRGRILSMREGSYRGELAFMMILLGEDGDFLGQHSETFEIRFDDAAYRKALEDGILIQKHAVLPVPKGAIKVIVYDPINDLLGAQTRRIQ